MQYLEHNIHTYQSGKPAHEGGRSPSWGFVSLCITIYRWKNHLCKKLQWCLWRFMYPLSFHQVIEISILAFKKKKNSNTSMLRRPWNYVRQRDFPPAAGKTIGRTKLPSSVCTHGAPCAKLMEGCELLLYRYYLLLFPQIHVRWIQDCN